MGERWDAITGLSGDARRDLRWLRDVVWAAAYDPAPFDVSLLHGASLRVERVRRALGPRRRTRLNRRMAD